MLRTSKSQVGIPKQSYKRLKKLENNTKRQLTCILNNSHLMHILNLFYPIQLVTTRDSMQSNGEKLCNRIFKRLLLK